MQHREAVEFWKFAFEISAERFGIIRVQNGDQNIAPDIVITDPSVFEDAVRVDPLRRLRLDSINFGPPFRFVDAEEHDPAGGGKKEFEFGKLPIP